MCILVLVVSFLTIIAQLFQSKGLASAMTNNKQILLLEIFKEILWLFVTTLIAIGAMYPLISKLHYTMVWLNGLILILALTYFRYAILINSVYVLRSKWARFVLFLFNINFFVFVLRQEQRFMTIYDSYTMDDLGKPLRPLALQDTDSLMRYFFNEINFTVVFCLAMIVALSFRFIQSYWKTAHIRLNAGNEE